MIRTYSQNQDLRQNNRRMEYELNANVYRQYVQLGSSTALTVVSVRVDSSFEKNRKRGSTRRICNPRLGARVESVA